MIPAMPVTLSGPAFDPKATDLYESIHGKEGAHYNIFKVRPERAMDALKAMFPEGEANEMNFVLFSTSGVHGSYTTIEEALAEDGDVTFLIVQPRIVCLRYGNVPVTAENVNYLKKLRATSSNKARQIGFSEEG
jgi:hypothetical protein